MLLEWFVLDIVLGVSIAPASVQMIVVEGENADGAVVEEDGFSLPAPDDTQPTAVPDRVISAILGTREGATDAGLELSSIGVTWTDQLHAAVLRDALASYKLENVMLVSAFLAATALGQSVGGAMGYESTAVLFVEPDTATLAVVETADGSITDVYKEQIVAESYGEATAQLTGMLSWLDDRDFAPGGVFLIGSGVDLGPIKLALDSATALTVSAPEEPETALARGAALASANAPLFASSTAALAYAQDPGTGTIDPHAMPEYFGVSYLPGAESGDELAYSLVPDEDADAPTVVIDPRDLGNPDDEQPRRRPMLLVGSGMAVVAITAVVALEIALAIGIRTTDVAVQPSPKPEPDRADPARTRGASRRSTGTAQDQAGNTCRGTQTAHPTGRRTTAAGPASRGSSAVARGSSRDCGSASAGRRAGAGAGSRAPDSPAFAELVDEPAGGSSAAARGGAPTCGAATTRGVATTRAAATTCAAAAPCPRPGPAFARARRCSAVAAASDSSTDGSR
ncbi:hypothetical protein [Mycobacterium simiae]|uniref:DUF7159 family protein n=1 Tax=Mycobacterium simiae TaxID=1784 RepID=UPI00040FA84F|nr:hypothetical protein [Mycobacterium simiae]